MYQRLSGHAVFVYEKNGDTCCHPICAGGTCSGKFKSAAVFTLPVCTTSSHICLILTFLRSRRPSVLWNLQHLGWGAVIKQSSKDNLAHKFVLQQGGGPVRVIEGRAIKLKDGDVGTGSMIMVRIMMPPLRFTQPGTGCGSHNLVRANWLCSGRLF